MRVFWILPSVRFHWSRAPSTTYAGIGLPRQVVRVRLCLKRCEEQAYLYGNELVNARSSFVYLVVDICLSKGLVITAGRGAYKGANLTRFSPTATTNVVYRSPMFSGTHVPCKHEMLI